MHQKVLICRIINYDIQTRKHNNVGTLVGRFRLSYHWDNKEENKKQTIKNNRMQS